MTMKDVFARLGADFFSTILFIAIYLATDNVLLATGWRSQAPSRR
jgi:intracellular septation protein